MSLSRVDHRAASQAKWYYPLSCQIQWCSNTPDDCRALQRLRAFNMNCKYLPLFPLAWHISPLQQLTPWCSFPFSFFYSLALFAAKASAVYGIHDCFERGRNTSQKHWAVAVATLSSSAHDFQYFKKFPDTLQASGKQCRGRKWLILK